MPEPSSTPVPARQSPARRPTSLALRQWLVRMWEVPRGVRGSKPEELPSFKVQSNTNVGAEREARRVIAKSGRAIRTLSMHQDGIIMVVCYKGETSTVDLDARRREVIMIRKSQQLSMKRRRKNPKEIEAAVEARREANEKRRADIAKAREKRRAEVKRNREERERSKLEKIELRRKELAEDAKVKTERDEKARVAYAKTREKAKKERPKKSRSKKKGGADGE